jgi:two-component system chemotaxis sensor kinase CheA
MDLSKYADLFLTESREHLAVINQQLLELERAPEASEPVGAIFRAVHTVKGMSATMGYAAVTALAHELEGLLDRLRRGERRVTPTVMDVLFRAVDALEEAVERAVLPDGGEVDVEAVVEHLHALAAGEDGGAPVGVRPAVAGVRVGPAAGSEDGNGARANAGAVRGPRTVRIDLRRLDTLMNLVGELVIARDRLVQLAGATGDSALEEAVSQASRLVGDLQDEIMLSRMVPVGHVFGRFPRLVRDAANALGKQIEFTIEGGSIELDRSMLDEIGDPVVHLLRNAIDHGIEAPEARRAAGKPEAGRLTLSVTRQRSTVVIRVTDDGRGIDRTGVLRRARALGLVESESTELSDEELARLIARPGFSTAERVTDLSGRGVGIDVVMTRVRALGGAVEIRSEPGQGTTITLRLPLTLAIVRALLARVRDEVYAVPMAHVSETLELAPQAIRYVQGREVMIVRDAVLPLLRFRELVELPPAEHTAHQVIVLEAGNRRTGLVVDELTGQQDIVVKQFDPAREAISLFSGATILSDGAPALIVDVGSLM